LSLFVKFSGGAGTEIHSVWLGCNTKPKRTTRFSSGNFKASGGEKGGCYRFFNELADKVHKACIWLLPARLDAGDFLDGKVSHSNISSCPYSVDNPINHWLQIGKMAEENTDLSSWVYQHGSTSEK
jgi:hypothetical protein